jgi:putative oxidoreductase
MEIGLLIMRIIVGVPLAAHGAQKLFGMFGGHGFGQTSGMFESMGFRPGKLLAALAGLGEIGGGLALALGLLTPLAAAVIVATMVVAVWGVHLKKGFFAQNGGYEYPLILGAVAAAIAFTGPGSLSVDAVAGWSLAGAKWGLIAVALGIAGALPPLWRRAQSWRRNTRA